MTEASRANGRSARRRSRECALQGIYEWLLKGANPAETGDIDAHIRDAEGFAEADFDHYRALFHGVMAQAPALRERFSPFLDREVGELSPVEHGILLVGAFELVNNPEIPYKVVINEAVELAKSFGGTDGFKFVNGVLDKLAAVVRAPEVEARRQR